MGDSSAENPWGDLVGITVAMSQQCIPALKKSNRVLDGMNKCRTSRLMEVIALSTWHTEIASYQEHEARLFSYVAGGQEATDVD